MLGVEGYGSDSDDDTQQTPVLPLPKAAAPPKKSGFSLPPPSAGATTSSAGLSLPAPKKKAPKKVAIGLPTLAADNGNGDTLDDEPPAKKPRIDMGAGSSSLFSMLPAPKNKNPIAPSHERVLGGGRGPGLVFNTGVKKASASTTVEDVEDEDEDVAPKNAAPLSSSILEEVTEKIEVKKPASTLPFLPPSLAKGKANVSTEDRPTMSKVTAARAANTAPAVDFFSLGSSSSSLSSLTPRNSAPQPSTSSAASSTLTISSAPKVDDFVIPEPTPNDPYPGYYMLPSGSWAAYDPDYYQKFYKKWKKEYDAHVRALEKGIEKGFEGVEQDGATDVNALEEMERAKTEIQEREEKKALTQAAGDVPVAPKMNIKGAALSGRARTRHQLSTLLTEAYQNREALEERIAQAKRNRKEAGNKYGF